MDKAYKLRPHQKQVLSYQSGRMGISAVPGSGKTWTLSMLAADLISRGVLEDNQEILVVTLVNSAVDNFSRRISEFLHQRGLMKGYGYRVRTLHGLAHDIVRERPGMVGLSDDFQIIDEQAATRIRNGVVQAWLSGHPGTLDSYILPDIQDDPDRLDWVTKNKLPNEIQSIANAFIRTAKSHSLTPDDLQNALKQAPEQGQFTLFRMGLEIYKGYQQALAYRGAVDFDDLIRLAYMTLQRDTEYLERLQYRWPYILEDEAQDSSRIQEDILNLLVGINGNWVRVGDPNQAIYETFTTADPRYLIEFINQADHPMKLPTSGRSQPAIIELANTLIEWVCDEHPHPQVRDALVEPLIRPAGQDDPQPNPPTDPDAVHLWGAKYSPERELQVIVNSVAELLEAENAKDPEDRQTIAVLAPTNSRGANLVEGLKNAGLEPVDSLLKSSTSTRVTAGALTRVMEALASPRSAKKLSTAYRVWRRDDREDEELAQQTRQFAKVIRGIENVEDYLWPKPGHDWITNQLEGKDALPEQVESLEEFRRVIRRWQGTVLLPVDQMILTLAQDLFSTPVELALAHKLSIMVARALRDNPGWHLQEAVNELKIIARNERRFTGFSEDDLGFDPEKYRGRVVVATAHKSKGLEWDRVYLTSVNNYDFPSAEPGDNYIAEAWFARDNLNLQEETLEQLQTILSDDPFTWYQEGQATNEARLEYARERLRLLYVGITRARRSLVMTWNTGRRGDQLQAVPFLALQHYWEENHNDTTA